MGMMVQGIDYKMFKSGQFGEFGFWEGFYVGQIGHFTELEP